MEKQPFKRGTTADTKASFSFFLAVEKLFSEIADRPRGIIEERYGIKSKSTKTLEEIGKQYHITRERVRQIIKETIKKLKKRDGELVSSARNQILLVAKEKGGILKEEKLLSSVTDYKEKGALKFFLTLFDGISFKEIPGELEESWALDDFNVSEWRRIKNAVKEILATAKHSLTDSELVSKMEKEKSIVISEKKLLDYLDVSSEIKKGNFGKWGLTSWDEISPKGTREKIYLVLKETGKPLHFRTIASLIDSYKLNKKKNTHPQTVHNELIRDRRFVLVGRGIYALEEWGYERGTVKDVLEDILRKNSRPMEREEIMNKILSVRKVKKSTVLINLNNFFEKIGKNQYSIRK